MPGLLHFLAGFYLGVMLSVGAILLAHYQGTK